MTTAASALDEQGLIELTREFMRIPTPNPPADYSVIAPRVRVLMEALGLDVRVMEGQAGKPNVLGLWRGSGNGPTLLLDAHMDVVDAGQGWEHDPWAAELVDGVIWGRGAADMKHSLAILIHVVKALKTMRFAPKGNLIIAATNDDETAGKMGLKYVIEEGLAQAGWPTPDFHLLLEASDWNVNLAYKGRVWVRVTVGGVTAHGGKPEVGVNAIVKTMDLVRAVLALPRAAHPLIGADSINVGTISGGERTNVVPDACTVTFDYRFVPPLRAEDAASAIRRVADDLAARDPHFRVCEFEVFEQRDPLELPETTREIVLLRQCIEAERGVPSAVGGALSAGNAYWSLRRGLTATMTGPGMPDLIHTSKEHISVKALTEGARITLDFASRYLG